MKKKNEQQHIVKGMKKVEKHFHKLYTNWIGTFVERCIWHGIWSSITYYIIFHFI